MQRDRQPSGNDAAQRRHEDHITARALQLPLSSMDRAWRNTAEAHAMPSYSIALSYLSYLRPKRQRQALLSARHAT